MRRLVLGLAIAMMAGLIPGYADGDDQAIARHITQALQMEQERGNLSGFHLNLRVDQGTVWYEGFVSSEDQKTMVLRTAQRAKDLGVVQIVDDIEVRGQGAEMAHQASMGHADEMHQAGAHQQATYRQQDMMSQRQVQTAAPQPMMANSMAAGYAMPAQVPMPVQAANYQNQPMPISYNPGAGIQADNPSLPNYAWPGYAAHPNYAALTYPRQYSPSAWPYIGPFYPYPQVPLGWRKVTLEWDDGWWWLDFHSR